MANPYLKPYTQGLRRAKGRTQRKPFQTGIAPGDEPTSKLGNKVVYGQRGLQTGVPKSMQLRNRGAFGGPNAPKPPLDPTGGHVPQPLPGQTPGIMPGLPSSGPQTGPYPTYPIAGALGAKGPGQRAPAPTTPNYGQGAYRRQNQGQNQGNNQAQQGQNQGNNMGLGRDTYLAQFGDAFATSGPYAGTVVNAATGLPRGNGNVAYQQQLQDSLRQIQATAAGNGPNAAAAQAALDKIAGNARGNLGAAWGDLMNPGSNAVAMPGQEGYEPYRQRLRDAGLPNFQHPFWNLSAAEQRSMYPEIYAAYLDATTVGGQYGGAPPPLVSPTGAGGRGLPPPELTGATNVPTGPSAPMNPGRIPQPLPGQTPGIMPGLPSSGPQTGPYPTGLPPTNPQIGGQTPLGGQAPLGRGAQQQVNPLDQLLSSNGLPTGGVNTQGLPLDATFEAQRRLADDQLSRALSSIGPGRESIVAQQGLAQARLGTQQGIDQQALIDQMAGRGTLSSSIANTERGNLATAYLRQNQDLSADVADAYGALSEAASGAYGDYARQMAEYLLELANRSASDPNAPIDRYQRGPKTKRKKKRRQ